MDEILIHETQKLSAVREAPGFLDYDYDEKNFIRLKMSLENTKETLE